MPSGVYAPEIHPLRLQRGAATRLGLSHEDYLAKLRAGMLWCTGCREWHPREAFGSNRARESGKNSHCGEWLKKHYHQTHVPKSPEERKRPPRTPAEVRFWRHVKKLENGCWEWQGRCAPYGSFRVTPENRIPAHHFLWEQENGPLPDGLMLCHHCDNPPCVNPAHLFPGTHQDNMDDRVRKGRGRGGPGPHWPGEMNPSAKLSREDVEEIRSLYIPRRVPYRVLAERFGMSKRQIQNIICGWSWKENTV